MDHQLDNGAWYYGTGNKWHWIDSFHTGYVLEALFQYIKYTDDTTYMKNHIKGYNFFINSFFTEEGIPKYYYNRVAPIDIQCASQSIQTLVNLRSFDKNQTNPNRTDYFKSNRNGKLEINSFIENRSILFITPTNSFQFILAKLKMWILAVIIIGFIASNMIWIRKKNGNHQNKDVKILKETDDFKITKSEKN